MSATPGERSWQVPSWWPEETRDCYADLLSYRLVGASACADRIATALEALSIQADADGRHVSAELSDAGRAFCALKPDTALYVNVVAYFTAQNGALTSRRVVERAEALRAYRQHAQEEVVRATANALEDAAVILVHDYSSAVSRVLGELGRRGAREIIVTAGEPLRQGPRVARLAAEAGHRVTYVPDVAVGRHSSRLDAFITGVEAFYADGSLTNTIGTLPLALVSLDAGAIVIAPAESLKLHPSRSAACVDDLTARLLHPWPDPTTDLEPSCLVDDHVLDAVPSRLVTSYVTELGSCTPAEVGGIAAGVMDRLAS